MSLCFSTKLLIVCGYQSVVNLLVWSDQESRFRLQFQYVIVEDERLAGFLRLYILSRSVATFPLFQMLLCYFLCLEFLNMVTPLFESLRYITLLLWKTYASTGIHRPYCRFVPDQPETAIKQYSEYHKKASHVNFLVSQYILDFGNHENS